MKKFSLSTFNKFFLATLGLLVITGCSTMPPVYDELPSMPEYKPSEKQYDKSAVIRFKPSGNRLHDYQAN